MDIRSRDKAFSTKGIWLVAVLLTVLIHFTGLWLFVPKEEEKIGQEKDSFRILWWPDSLHSEKEGLKVLLRETSPLFLPGPWNAPLAGEARLLQRRPEEPFPLHGPSFDLEVAALREGVGEVVPPAPGLGDVLQLPRTPFRHLWQEKQLPIQVPTSARKIHFQSVGPGANLEVTGFRPSEPESRPSSGPRPATVFRYHQSVMGPVGLLVLERGSGDENLDAWRRNLLKQEILPEVFLDPGYYFVEIGL
ncbi:MAG: hypothetical protein JJT75_12430 [Opitutales bacterium]|nr:hypothetical protein [Opitutales bacterium]MCH8540140.1 hypothetical protein [Opitutales bacterium]